MGGVSGKMVQERAVAGDVRGLEELLKSQAEGQAELASWVENESYSVLMAVAEKNMNNNAEKGKYKPNIIESFVICVA